MPHNLLGRIILPSIQWASIYGSVPSVHSLSKTIKSFNVSDCELDDRIQDQ